MNHSSARHHAPQNWIACSVCLLCLKEDHTISYQGWILQLPRASKYASIAKQRVEVLELRDGSWEVIYKQQPILRLTRTAIEKMKEKK